MLDAANRAAHFVLQHSYQPEEGRLLRRFRDGESAIPGFLDDYAFFIQGLLDLFRGVAEPITSRSPMQLASSMIELFEDKQPGRILFDQRRRCGGLVMRMKDDYDGAEPSGNSYAIQVLVKLAHLTGREDFQSAADRALAAFSDKLEQGPAVPQMLAAWISSQMPPRRVVLVGESKDASMNAMQRSIAQHFLPFATTISIDSGDGRKVLAQYMPALASMAVLDGKTTAYVCDNFACQLPVSEVAALSKMLG